MTKKEVSETDMENYNLRHLFEELFEILPETKMVFTFKQAVGFHRILAELEEMEVDLYSRGNRYDG